jgi:hypothetical protein
MSSCSCELTDVWEHRASMRMASSVCVFVLSLLTGLLYSAVHVEPCVSGHHVATISSLQQAQLQSPPSLFLT